MNDGMAASRVCNRGNRYRLKLITYCRELASLGRTSTQAAFSCILDGDGAGYSRLMAPDERF